MTAQRDVPRTFPRPGVRDPRVRLLDGRSPQHLWLECGPVEPVDVRAGDGQEVGQQFVAEQERHQAEVEQLGVRRAVVVLLQLDPRVVEVHDPGSAGGVGDLLRQLTDREGLGELVEHAELAGLRWGADRELDAGQRVADVEETAGLATLAVHRERLAGRCLDHEAVEDRAEDGVVVEAGRQVGVERGLRRRLAVDDALVEVGRAQAPGPATEGDVVAVVHLGEVVEAARLLREGQHVGAAAVGDLDVPLFDVDVGGAVLPHRPELHQVDRRVDVCDRVEQVRVCRPRCSPACRRRACGRPWSTGRCAARRSGRWRRAGSSPTMS